MFAPTDSPRTNAHEHGPEWGVVRCACGRLYLKLGPMRLEFTPEQFHQLHMLIRDAGEHFGVFDADGAQIAPSPEIVTH